jgi:hypothetical protein
MLREKEPYNIFVLGKMVVSNKLTFKDLSLKRNLKCINHGITLMNAVAST